MQVITTHTNADFDTLASMLAAKKLYPDARLVFPGSQERGVRDFLLKSTFYIFQFEKAKDIDLNAVDTLILVDIRQSSRIGRFSEILKNPELKVYIYDHHPASVEDIHGDMEYILPYGSTTTILTHIIIDKGIDILPDEATVMLLGIYEDTGSLTYPSTTVKDFEAAAFLLSNGGDLRLVSDILAKELTAEDINLMNELLASATTCTVEGIDVVITTATVEHHIGDIALLVHKIRDISSMDVVISLVMMEDKVYLVARSRIKEVDVGEIAKEFGGGGHPSAASASIKDMTLIEAKEKLILLLNEKVRPRKRAKDLMSAAPIAIKARDTLERARDVLVRYSLNAMPVVKGSKVVGFISRQVVEKAMYHKLEDLPVEEYMTAEFEKVNLNSPLSRIQEIIIEHNQRILPVIEGGRLEGVITRTDLLRFLHDIAIKEKPYLREEEGFTTRKKYIKKLMKETLPIRVFKMLNDIGEIAMNLGCMAYVVGGFVRDILLRNENLDIDIVVEGDGIEFALKFASEYGCRVKSHKRFRTAVIIFPDGFKVDVATARLEYYERPGALPTVETSSIKLDLYRRDFTINTLAISLNPGSFGKLLDFYGGLRDIKAKSLRVIHNLSFVEDPTRVFRAVRFEKKFGFTLGKHTLKLIKNAVKLNLFKTLSGSRLFVELKIILNEEDVVDILKKLGDLDLLKFIHPSITLDKDEEKLLNKAQEVLAWFRLLYLEEKVERWLVLYLSLTNPMKQEEVVSLSKRFCIVKRYSWSVIDKRDYCLDALHKLLKGKPRHSDVYHILKTFPMECLLYMMAVVKKEEVRRTISNYVTRLRNYRPKLSGSDLMALNIPQGPECGKILQKLLEMGLDGEIKTREDEIEFVRKISRRRR